jgi:hypothetical protein
MLISYQLKSLQMYDIAQNYRILHKVVQRFSQHNLKNSNHCRIQNFVKKNNDLNKTCTYVHDFRFKKLHLSK